MTVNRAGEPSDTCTGKKAPPSFVRDKAASRSLCDGACGSTAEEKGVGTGAGGERE